MTLPTFIALLIFLAPLAWSPGPGNLAFAANGARFGLRATLRASLGYHLATWGVTLAMGLGTARLADHAPDAFHWIRLLGAGYVLWLALSLLRAGPAGGANAARPMGFTGGAVLLLFNPKAYVIIGLMLSQFLGNGQETTALLIATVFTLNNLVAFTAWTALGDRLARRFRDPAQARIPNLVFGAALALVAVWMALP